MRVIYVCCFANVMRKQVHYHRTTQFMVRRPAGEGSVLYLYTEFQADCSIRSKVIKGSQNFEIGSRDPGHANLWVALWSIRREAQSYMSVSNLKRIALFIQSY